jgi:hypothetical protein
MSRDPSSATEPRYVYKNPKTYESDKGMASTILELMRMKLEILKLKADDYNWQCHVPKDVRQELEQMLVTINRDLEVLAEENEKIRTS